MKISGDFYGADIRCRRKRRKSRTEISGVRPHKVVHCVRSEGLLTLARRTYSSEHTAKCSSVRLYRFSAELSAISKKMQQCALFFEMAE